MSNKDYNFLCRKAEVLKAIAHPVRLSILWDLIENGEKRASDLNTIIDMDAASVSQHLTRMNNIGLFKKRRNGTEIYYSLVDVDGIEKMMKIFL